MAASALGVAAAGAARRRAAGHRLVALPACGGHWLKALAPSGGPASASTSRPRRRSFSSGPLDDDAPGVAPGRKPVDTTTPRDQQMSLRHLERRIEEHRKKGGEGTPEAEAERAGEVADGQVVPAAQGPLRIVDPDAPAANENKDVVVRSRTTTGQVLWPATEEDIAILSQSKQLYPSPLEVEGSVIIRLVRLSDPVTSPVGRTVRNRQFGIRGNEKWQLLGLGALCAFGIYGLGVWQLQRMEWKRNLIETRRTRLAMEKVPVLSSPFPWKDQVDDFIYRVVEVRGVFDHGKEIFVGPRPGINPENGDSVVGYQVVTPLRLEDGSTVLVNRGHLDINLRDRSKRPEVPAWVRVRGVLEEGEIPNFTGRWARLKNRPDKNMYLYLVADELAENAGARNHEECKQAFITATDVLYEDDFKAGVRRLLPFAMKHKEDYLLFWADEHTHFNYAMQWFGMGTLIMSMTIYKFIEVMRWRF